VSTPFPALPAMTNLTGMCHAVTELGPMVQEPVEVEQALVDNVLVDPDLRRLVPDGPVDRPVAVDPAHPAHVDELELLLGLDDVIRLEVAVHQPCQRTGSGGIGKGGSSTPRQGCLHRAVAYLLLA